MSDASNKENKNINFKIDEYTHRKLKYLALDNSQTLKEFLKTTLIKLVNKEVKL